MLSHVQPFIFGTEPHIINNFQLASHTANSQPYQLCLSRIVRQSHRDLPHLLGHRFDVLILLLAPILVLVIQDLFQAVHKAYIEKFLLLASEVGPFCASLDRNIDRNQLKECPRLGNKASTLHSDALGVHRKIAVVVIGPDHADPVGHEHNVPLLFGIVNEFNFGLFFLLFVLIFAHRKKLGVSLDPLVELWHHLHVECRACKKKFRFGANG